MQQKIIEIIEFLIAEINQLQEPYFPDIDRLSKKLLEKGYTEKDIQEAVEWIAEFIDRPTGKRKDDDGSGGETGNLRILSQFESKLFSGEAYAFLIQIQKLKLVSPLQVEHILDRCLMMGMELVTLEDVKSATTQILLGKETGFSDTNALYHPGNDKIH